MLIDSHCHLDFPDFADDLDGRDRARAAPPASGRMITISTRVRQLDTYRAIAEAHDNVFFTVGTHPHQAAEEPDVAVEDHRRARATIRAASASARRASTIIMTAARATSQERVLPHAYRGGARDRAAARHPCARRRRRHGQHPARRNGAGGLQGRAPLFLVGPELAETGSNSGFSSPSRASSPSRTRRSCATSRAPCRSTGMLVETDAPFLAPEPLSRQAQRAGLCRRYGRALAGSRAVRRRICRPDDANFHRLFARPARARRMTGGVRSGTTGREVRMATLTLRILGCGSSGGVPRVGYGWGACDPANPRNRRRRCSILVEAQDGDGDDGAPRRHLAGPARAAPRRRRRAASTACCSPMRTPTTRTASTMCGRSSSTCGGASVYGRIDPAALERPLRLYFQLAAGQQLPAAAQLNDIVDGRTGLDRGPGRGAEARPSAWITATRRSGLPFRSGRLYARPQLCRRRARPGCAASIS